MGVSSFDRGCVDVLRRLARCDHLSVVVGAGASIAAQLPGWEELVTKLTSGTGPKSREVAELVTSTQGFLLAAEGAFPLRSSASQRKKKVARALYGNEPRGSFVPSQLHQSVAQLARVRGSSRLQIFTTNYDDLLEQAMKDEGLSCRPRFAARNPPGDPFPIHHIHGYLGPSAESDDIVLGQSDYARVAEAQKDWPAEEISTAAGRGPIVFIGTSLTDPNLLRMLERIRGRGYDPHVLVITRQGLKVPGHLREPFAKRLASQWQRYNVQVVLLDDFSDVSLFVREIGAAAESGYTAPLERVVALWDRIAKHFAEAQERFSTALEQGFEQHLRKLLGNEAGLVLWLADGRGSLVRFAANDRLYRSPSALRRIPDQFEAGWVVSEAVAFEGTFVRDLSRSHGPETRVPDSRWKVIAAVPLRPPLASGGPTIAGALSAATVQLGADAFANLAEVLESELAADWEDHLIEFYR